MEEELWLQLLTLQMWLNDSLESDEAGSSLLMYFAEHTGKPLTAQEAERF